MKAIKFIAVALAAITMVACAKKDGDVEVEKVTLNQTTVKVAVGATVTLTATVEPAGAAKVEWSSSAQNIAVVNDGVVTGVANGRAVITAKAGSKSATCIVEVGEVKEIVDFPGLDYVKGSDYYLFVMGAETSGLIEGKITDDFRANGDYAMLGSDGVTSVWEIWNAEHEDEHFPACTGPNSFNIVEGWLNWAVGTTAWGNYCGGLRQGARTIDLSKVTKDHTLVIIYKTPGSNNQANGAIFTLYSTSDTGTKEVALKCNSKSPEWTVAEFNMGELFDKKGLDWSKPVEVVGVDPATYVLGITIDGLGQGLEVDAAFIYKK